MKLLHLAGMMLAGLSCVHGQSAKIDSLIPNSAIRRTEVLQPIVLDPYPYMLPIAKASVRGSYPLELSYNKTTHIVFPSKIRDFDAGNDAIIAMVPEKILNVLRVKSDSKGFMEETNMTVFTEDGGLYSFLVRFNENPTVFNLNMTNNTAADIQATLALGIGKDLNAGSNSFVRPSGSFNENDIMYSSREALARKDNIRRTGVRGNDFQVFLKGIYLDKNNVLYLKLELKNKSYMPYQIDFIKLFVRDRTHARRMAEQQEEIPAIMKYPENVTHLNGLQKLEKVVSIPYYTLTDGKVLEMEIYEKGGGRHLKLQFTNETLLKVKPLGL
ncbi:conjugative transposon protein TraN [Telluribacter sp.]|jgi:conjugative transposon TraN protein|uniref:conjugative transposon protein TraN n=1 Tax=Telluribacter sp. TaxID=1978767 RepID=UPI002E126FD0|nr:conjugative transposon protein TraN [Telluribacter sp.]